MTGIYIHVPFCIRKCPYCDFYSVKLEDTLLESYVEALLRNIDAYKGRNVCADTVYFGGGTPSLLSCEQIEKIISACEECFLLSSPEITIEANPCTVDFEKLCGYRKAGVTRISFGVQSADNSQLEFLRRLHNFETAEKAVENAKKAGFENISCDIMLGLSGQTLESLVLSLDKLSQMPINHISAYMLKIEKGTRFDCDEIKKSVANEDLMCDMYLKTVEYLSEKGFEQYEISNFARNENYSRHNLKYWQCENYIGFGPASHSFFDNERYCCPRDIKSFCEQKIQTKVVLETSPDKLEEYVMLNLRLKWGISLDEVEVLADKAYAMRMQKKAELYEKNGLCVVNDRIIHLTPTGFLLSNDLIVELLDC